MDNQKFDGITKALATGTSRRSVVRGIFGGALAAAGLSRVNAAPMEKVVICHYDADTGLYHSISVSGNAYDAHVAHGDLLSCGAGYELNGETCTCEPIYFCEVLNGPCGEGGRCVEDVDTGLLVCANDPGYCEACSTASDCVDNPGICASDGNCGFDHCHPLHGV